jgi:hypothetical protein
MVCIISIALFSPSIGRLHRASGILFALPRWERVGTFVNEVQSISRRGYTYAGATNTPSAMSCDTAPVEVVNEPVTESLRRTPGVIDVDRQG